MGEAAGQWTRPSRFWSRWPPSPRTAPAEPLSAPMGRCQVNISSCTKPVRIGDFPRSWIEALRRILRQPSWRARTNTIERRPGLPGVFNLPIDALDAVPRDVLAVGTTYPPDTQLDRRDHRPAQFIYGASGVIPDCSPRFHGSPSTA